MPPWWNVNPRGEEIDIPFVSNGTTLGEDPITLIQGTLQRIQDSYFSGLGRPPSQQELDFLWQQARSGKPGLERDALSEVL